jgi:hypothetical protein
MSETELTDSKCGILPNTTPISSTDQTNEGSTNTVAPPTELTEVSAGSKRLHVTNLPFRIRDSDLQEMFGVNFEINLVKVRGRGRLVRKISNFSCYNIEIR